MKKIRRATGDPLCYSMQAKYLCLLNKFVWVLTIIALFTSLANSQIILSEVMFDPIGEESYNEFLEIFNISYTDTIDLADWRISDGSDMDRIIAYEQGTYLKPNQYAIILDAGYFENSQQYDNLIHPEALVLTIDNATFGSNGLSNSQPEPIILISSTGDTVAKYRYTLNNKSGYSDEKKNLFGNDDEDNWANSKRLNGTPGFENSVCPKAFDIMVEMVGFPPEALPGQSITLIAAIINQGLNNASNIAISFFEDLNLDNIITVNEQIVPSITITDSIQPGEQHQVSIQLDSLASGRHVFYVDASFPVDQDTSNNFASTIVKIGFAAHTIFITEIMYRPIAGQAEWFELFNSSQQPINLQDWQISDAITDRKFILTDSVLFLHPEEYLIVAQDSAIFQIYQNIPCRVIFPAGGFPGLNNNGDQIILYDLITNVNDQVKYQPSWGNEIGVSLEKKLYLHDSNDPSNWGLSQNHDGATPGFKNSISPKDNDLCLKLSINRINPDSIFIMMTVTNVGLLSANQFRCDFYFDNNLDSIGQTNEFITYFSYQHIPLIPEDSVTIVQTIPVFKSGSNQLIADLVYGLDEDNSNNIQVVPLIVPFRVGQLKINEIMFRPLADDPEWIEIFNPGMDSINLSGWKFSDAIIHQKRLITSQDFWIGSKQYVILAESGEIYSKLPDTLFHDVIISQPWSDLNNNTADQVVLYDLTDKMIDSINYAPHWNPLEGISLERIDYLLPGSDSSNWAVSIDSSGSTPGRFNSVSPVNFDLAVTEINFNPSNPFPEQEITIDAEILNTGSSAISEFQLSYFIDLNQDGVYQNHEIIDAPHLDTQILNRGDAITVSLPYIPSNSGCFSVNVTVISGQDLNPSNDSKIGLLSVGFKQQSLVINEIMYSPPLGQPEWIELFNPQQISVDVQNWSFSDSDSSARLIITNNHFIVVPQTFLVIAPDSTISNSYDLNNSPLLTIKNFPRLNDNLDKIFVFDANNNIIDEVAYVSSWGGSDSVSLERINPHLSSVESSNWSSCVLMTQRGTPGQKNSIYVDVLPTQAELTISPNPFSPDGDGRDDFTIISYQLPFNLSKIHIKIFDIRGRLVRFLVNNQPSGTNNYITWDGRDDQRQVCRMGIYIVYLEAIHYQKGVVRSLKKSVVLAKPL